MTVEYSWVSLGDVVLDGDRLLFTPAGAVPGLYRFELVAERHGEVRERVYVGETDDLARRFQHYRTPGQMQQTKTQQTNRRLNELMRRHLHQGGQVRISVITEAQIQMEGETAVSRPADLTKHAVRTLMEAAAIQGEHARGGVEVLNLPGVGEALAVADA